MGRRKAEALPVPATTEEAVSLVSDYTALEREGLLDELAAAEQVGRIKAQLAQRRAEREAVQKRRFAMLKAWWEATGAALFAGKKRSGEVAGIKLGTRLAPPALKLPKGKTAAEVLGDLMTWLAGDFIRTKHELDKEAIIAALRRRLDEDADEIALHERRVLEQELKLSVVQVDEFFIDTGLDPVALRKEIAAAG